MGISWTRGYMIDGPPGCGKTSIVKAISNAAKLDIYILRLSTISTDAELEHLFSLLPNRCKAAACKAAAPRAEREACLLTNPHLDDDVDV